jgi:alkylation response protein AidB-like acyl-CoA dehydrogenase
MDFSFSKKQLAYKKSIIEFSKEELNDEIISRDHQGSFSFENWKKCADMGYMGFLIPENYGGIQENLTTTVLCMEALSYGCLDSGLIHAIVTQICCGVQLSLYGNIEQKAKYLPKLASGEKIAAQALTESDAGSDFGSMQTTAEKRNGKYILNGTKLYISNGPIADFVLVMAVSDLKKKKLGGLSCFIVNKEMQGFSKSYGLDKIGLRTLQNSELVFKECQVPVGNLISEEGQGMFIFNEVIEWERALMAACHLGTMQRLLEACVSYAKKRRQFGKPIGKFQSISNKITDMKTNIELGKLILYKAAWLKDQKKRATLETSLAKLFISEKLKSLCLEAVQIHGAYGIMKEAELERDLRDSIAATIYSGTSEIQKNIISAIAGL